MLYSLIKPILFSLDPEFAHYATLKLLQTTHRLKPQPTLTTQPAEVMGIQFPNRIGLAAGLDKNGQYIDALGKLGFGFIEIGTVTPKPQSGNPKPRLFRLVDEKAIINRMGFNNRGVEALVNHVKQSKYPGVLGINIGKNKDTPNASAIEDYLYCLAKVYAYADYITINISSPNTQGLRDLQHKDELQRLLEAIKVKQLELAEQSQYTPIAVKIAPDLSGDDISNIANIVKQSEIDAVIATNTTIDKNTISRSKYAKEDGGLSGQPLTQKSTQIISLLADSLGSKIPIIGVGGIMSVADAQDKLNAGASLVQVYTGLIYQGPQLIKQLQQLQSSTTVKDNDR